MVVDVYARQPRQSTKASPQRATMASSSSSLLDPGVAGPPTTKRRRLGANPLEPLSSNAIIKGAGTQTRALVRAVEREDEQFANQTTPYGLLRKQLALPTKDNDITKVDYLCPMAFLHLAAMRAPWFAGFLWEHLGSKVGRIALYSDTVRPGNALRPDKARSFEAIYWTLMEFPQWFRSSASGWLSLLYISSQTLAKVKGGLSKVMEQLLLAIWPSSGFNMGVSGIRITKNPMACPGGAMAGPCFDAVIRARFGCFVADERALKAIAQGKGSSGLKPCLRCANILSGDPDRIPATSPLKHYRHGVPEEFDQWTSPRFMEVRDRVLQTWRTCRKHEALEVQKILGVSYEEGEGLIWGPASNIAQIPVSLYYDSMHSLWASGGVAQYELNQFIVAVVDVGVSWEQLQTWLDLFVFPPGRQHLKSFKLSDRVVAGPDSHLRGFAGEVLSLVTVFAQFGLMCLQPRGLLLPNVRSLCLLARLRDYFQAGEQSWLDPTQAREVNREHHQLFVQLYPSCVKPKLHFIWHLFDSHLDFQVRLSSFATERKHKLGKGIGAFAFRNLTKTILTRAMLHELEEITRHRAITAECLLGQERPCKPGGWHKASSTRTRWGNMRVKELVRWSEPTPANSVAGPTARTRFGEALAFLRAPSGELHVQVDCHRCTDRGRWVSDGTVEVVPATSLLPSLPYMKDMGQKHICGGWDAQ